jgi:hypothetical protein
MDLAKLIPVVPVQVKSLGADGPAMVARDMVPGAHRTSIDETRKRIAVQGIRHY